MSTVIDRTPSLNLFLYVSTLSMQVLIDLHSFLSPRDLWQDWKDPRLGLIVTKNHVHVQLPINVGGIL